jgi:hypothetical protein
MANALSMIAGEGEHSFDPLGAFMEGRKARYDERLRKNALSELDREQQARTQFGNALRGDAGAMDQLAPLDPAAYIAADKFKKGNEAEELERIARGAYEADTPEKWAQFVQFGKARGWDFDPEEEDFANRGAIISQAQSIKDRMAQERGDRAFNLNQRNIEEDNAINRERLNIEQQKLDRGSLIDRRGQEAVAAGLQPGTPEYQSYVLTGKIQRAPGAGKRRMTEAEMKGISLLKGTESSIKYILQGGTPENPVPLLDEAAQLQNTVGSATPYVGRFIQSGEGQAISDALGNIAQSYLYAQSGQAATEAETKRIVASLLPRVGDGQPAIDQKKQRLLSMIEAIKARPESFSADRGEPGATPIPEPLDAGNNRIVVQPGSINEQNVENYLTMAKEAIDSGIDPEAVIANLVAGGVDEAYARAALGLQ